MSDLANRADAHTSFAPHSVLADRYSLLRVLGHGGMATVYLAEDRRHQRRVAVKFLRDDLAGSISSQRFLREIEIASKLTHPNILPLHDSGSIDGRLYYVMPFAEGPTLRALLDEQPGKILPTGEAIRIATEIADALAYAHQHQIVHRDIKPENILLLSGHAVVTDFGIAHAMGQATTDRLTSAQIAIGTPAYMSPEQGAAGVVDGRSDIYSLGVVVYEMLTGAPPSMSGAMAALQPRSSVSAARKRTGAKAVPGPLERAVAKAMSLDPAERYAEAREFASALQAGVVKRISPLSRAGLFAAALLLAAAGVWGVRVATEQREAAPALLAPLPHRVVVARLTNRTGLRQLDYLGPMAADWLTGGLQRTGVVDVVPTSTALQAEAQASASGITDPVRGLADQTNAGIVVTGAYYRDRGSLAIQVQISDALAGKLLGVVGPLRAPMDAVLPVIESVRSQVMGLLGTALDPRIAAAPTTPIQPPTFEAYREFSQGLDDYVHLDYRSAASWFVKAFDRDSSFASALLIGSISLSNLGQYGAADSLLDRLAPHRDRLAQLDRGWFDYRRSILRGNRPAALNAIRAVATAQPGTKATYNFAVEAMQNGYVIESLRALQSLPPDRGPMRGWASYWDMVSRDLHQLGRYTDERDAMVKARAAFPQRRSIIRASLWSLGALDRESEMLTLLSVAQGLPPEPNGITTGDLSLEGGSELIAHHGIRAGQALLERGLASYENRPPTTFARADRLTHARIEYALGRWNVARAEADSLLGMDPANVDYLTLAGTAAARDGDTTSARRIAATLEAMPRQYTLGSVSLGQAKIAALLGERERAVAALRRCFAEGHEFDLWIHRDMDLRVLAGYEPFEALKRPKPE